jgi:mono/diheme cytochrome c family protein
MKTIVLTLAALLGLVVSPAFAQHGYVNGFVTPSHTNSPNTGLVLNQNVAQHSQAAGGWYYERYEYYQCGRKYCGYRPVWKQAAAVKSEPVHQEFNPIGSVNTDNSTTHSYVYNITYGQLPVAQGSTLYGYSFSSVADVYGNTDIGALYNQAIRLAGDSNAYADKATSNAMSLVAQAGRERTKVAEILAKGQVIAQANASAAALASAVSTGTEVNVEASRTTESSVSVEHNVKQGDGKTEIKPEPKPVDTTSVQKIFDQRCVECHREGKEKGGLRHDDAAKLTVQDVEEILSRVTSPNPELRMPKGQDGAPGAALSVEEIAVLFKAATN